MWVYDPWHHLCPLFAYESEHQKILHKRIVAVVTSTVQLWKLEIAAFVVHMSLCVYKMWMCLFTQMVLSTWEQDPVVNFSSSPSIILFLLSHGVFIYCELVWRQSKTGFFAPVQCWWICLLCCADVMSIRWQGTAMPAELSEYSKPKLGSCKYLRSCMFLISFLCPGHVEMVSLYPRLAFALECLCS